MAKIILVDEVTMMDNRLLQALNDSLCDIMATDLPFGDKVLVISGDFRQTMPALEAPFTMGSVWRKSPEITSTLSPNGRYVAIMSHRLSLRACVTLWLQIYHLVTKY